MSCVFGCARSRLFFLAIGVIAGLALALAFGTGWLGGPAAMLPPPPAPPLPDGKGPPPEPGTMEVRPGDLPEPPIKKDKGPPFPPKPGGPI